MKIDRPVIIVLIFLATFMLAFFFAWPEYNTFKGLQADLSEKTAEYNAEFDYYAAIAKTYSDLQTRSTDISKVDDALPENPPFGDVVYYLQNTAQENGLVVKNLFLSKTSSESSSDEVGDNSKRKIINDLIFSINLSGNYAALEGFVAALEKSARIFEVTSISFGTSSSTGSLYNFSLQIKTHSY
jgi:Tfp pilus assembly protein PilO